MRRISTKHATRTAECRETRRGWIKDAGSCWICGHSEASPRTGLPVECSRLSVHEVANGPFRSKALDQPYACLVVCWACNSELCDKKLWPVSRQLAVLQIKAPERYNLSAYLKLVHAPPTRITQEEVDQWKTELKAMFGKFN